MSKMKPELILWLTENHSIFTDDEWDVCKVMISMSDKEGIPTEFIQSLSDATGKRRHVIQKTVMKILTREKRRKV